ncbi:hypothetical protein BH24CHL1_BH24CHL1_00820 [soil metagenome]
MTTAQPTRHEGVVVQNFQTETDAENAVRALRDAGFTTDEISVVAQDKERAEGVAGGTGEDVAAGTGIGAVTGGVLGGIAGLLVGAAALTIPGIGIVVAGPLAATLGGAGLGAITGGLAGALASIGVAEDDAQRYQEHYEAGDILVVVVAGGREADARRILESGGTPDMPLV